MTSKRLNLLKLNCETAYFGCSIQAFSYFRFPYGGVEWGKFRCLRQNSRIRISSLELYIKRIAIRIKSHLVNCTFVLNQMKSYVIFFWKIVWGTTSFWNIHSVCLDEGKWIGMDENDFRTLLILAEDDLRVVCFSLALPTSDYFWGKQKGFKLYSLYFRPSLSCFIMLSFYAETIPHKFRW